MASASRDQQWVLAGKRRRLSAEHVRMARALGLNPTKLGKILAGRDAQLRIELLCRVRGEETEQPRAAGRSVAHLLDAAQRHRDEREQRAARERAREQEDRERVAAAARNRRLGTLAGEGEGPWRQVAELIDTKKISQYDVAVTLLSDLYDLAARDGDPVIFAT